MTETGLLGSIRLPDGGEIRGRGLRKPLPAGPSPKYGLYLGSERFRRQHDARLPWAHHWLDWPDFMLPRDREAAIARIRALYQRAHELDQVEVACGGGVGRTGTVIACLAVLSGLSPADAIEWTRTNYQRRAVETPWQRRWISRFPAS